VRGISVTSTPSGLAEILLPGGGKANGSGPVPMLPARKTPTQIERPVLPLTSGQVLPPAPPKPDARIVRPRILPEELPLVRNFSQPAVPEATTMPTEALVRLWSWDVNEPLPLPILGTGHRDRASLDDPSLTASVAATLAKHHPERIQPVPFQAVNLPDPFEHTHAIRLRNPPDELPDPPLSLLPLGR
jgi:hypothetical protein